MDQLNGRFLLRRRLLATTATLAILTVLLPGPATAAVEDTSPAGRAAEWIAREYHAPDSEIKLFGTGVLIDSLVSLAATGTQPGVAGDMLEDLLSQAATYVGTGDSFNVGAAGKLIHVLSIYGRDVAAFASADIEAELRSSIQTAGADAGRFAEASVWDQALAVLGLSMTPGGAPSAAVDWLAGTQCPTGEFNFDGTCPGPTDADTTGIAVLALVAAGDMTTPLLSIEWLSSIQLPDGSIPGYGLANSNSTAAAAMAFVAFGETSGAQAAAGYLAAMQFPDAAGKNAGGLKWIDSDVAANTFATVQGVWGMGVPALHLIEAPTYRFVDSAASIFSTQIEWLGASGISAGCNPPLNSDFCPDDPVTRGQMAALLSRALNLAGAASSGFVDAAGSEFSAHIDAIAVAGITRGCNPPANDRFCPDELVTRGQMAAFLNRAFALGSGGASTFNDVDGSLFASDIDAIAAAGITRGCNPPANDRYCPDDVVTRGQMAAFIYRALH